MHDLSSQLQPDVFISCFVIIVNMLNTHTHVKQLLTVRPDRIAHFHHPHLLPLPEGKLHLCISMHGWSAIEMLICVFHQVDSLPHPPPKDNIYYKRKQYILARSNFVACPRSL